MDIHSNSAFHLDSVYAPDQDALGKEDKSRVDYYADWIIKRTYKLPQSVDTLCVDGYFAKQKFILPILDKTNLHIVCKMRNDANLYYRYKGSQKTGKGRKKKKGKKVNLKNIDKRILKKVEETDTEIIYEGIVYSVNLKLMVKLCYVKRKKNGKPTGKYAVLFSTNLDHSAKTIFTYYKSRFQIEFLFRDAKQYTGLTHNQARSEAKMNFHANASLSAINIAKAGYYLPAENSLSKPFSMANVKTENFNLFLLDFIFCNLDLKHNSHKLKELREIIKDIGKIAA